MGAAFQMTSDATAYVMAQQGYKIFPYIDDYILDMYRDKAVDAFQCLVHLLTELGLPMIPDKVCPPSTSLTCLGITIDLNLLFGRSAMKSLAKLTLVRTNFSLC